MNKKYFFQHPYELENDERYMLLRRKMWCEGTGIFWDVFMRLKRGNSTYPVSAILEEISGGRDTRKRKVSRVLTEFDLFVIDDGMVSLSTGFTMNELHPRSERKKSSRERLEKIQQSIADGYDDTLFPDETREMDEQALQSVQDEIRENNQAELSSLHL